MAETASEQDADEPTANTGTDYHRERLEMAGGVDLIFKTRGPTEIDINERFRDAGSINTEDLSHVEFEVVARE